MPIVPSDINTADHFWSAFDHCETETAARYIVAFCQERGTWDPFTFDEINAYYQKTCKARNPGRFTFNRLVSAELVRSNPWSDPRPQGGGWITLDRDGNYHLTMDFIARCFKSSPSETALEKKIIEP